MSANELLRTVRLTPYVKDRMLPTFTLRLWATPKRDWRGQTRLAYELRQHLDGRTSVIFQGDDFYGSPLHADDSDATVVAMLDFLTLRPGDTDPEYFDGYTEEQLRFAQQHAESLSAYAAWRFGYDD